MKICNWLFPNWQVVKVQPIYHTYTGTFIWGEKYAETKCLRIEIQYSDKLKKYRVKAYGYRAKFTNTYAEFIKQCLELNNHA